MKKLLIILFSIFIIYFSTEWVVRGIHYIVFKSSAYISFVSPILHWTKYFAVAFLLVVLFKKYVTLAPAGQKIIPILLVLTSVMFLVSSLWFNAVNEEKIVKHRVFLHSVKTWEEVDYVSTEINHEEKVVVERTNNLGPLKVIPKYNIHFEDGSVLNLWNDLPSIYELHQFVLENNIEVEYLTESKNFDQNFAYYFKDSLDQAHYVFGVE